MRPLSSTTFIPVVIWIPAASATLVPVAPAFPRPELVELGQYFPRSAISDPTSCVWQTSRDVDPGCPKIPKYIK